MKYIALVILSCITQIDCTAQEWQSRILQYNSTQVSTDEYSTLMDYDGDGLKDVVFGNLNLKELFLFRNQDNAPMQMELLTDTLFGVLALHGFNYNNDNYDDLLLGLSTTEGYQLFLLISQGEGVFQKHFVCEISSDGLNKIVTNDFDSDGDVDIIFDDFENSNIIYTVSNNGDNTFMLSWISYTGQPTGLFGSADLDNDGDQDLLTVFFSFAANSYQLVAEENIGNMEFTQHVLLNIPNVFDGLIGDFDSDGFQDIILSYTNSDAKLISNDGDFIFNESLTILGIPAYARLSIAYDADNDGDEDFMVTNGTELELYSQDNGSFIVTGISDSAPGEVAALYDFNQDGQEDLLFKVRDIWFKEGDSYQPTYSSYLSPNSVIEVGSIFSDGNKDIITAGGAGQLDVFNQRFDERFDYAQSTFMSGANINFSTPIREMIAFDREGDGDSDVLCTISDGVYWLINNNGTFVQQTLANNTQAYKLWIGDIDNDNNHDILYYDGQLRRREWNGNSYSMSNLPVEVSDYFAALDVDGDLDKDIIYFNYDINTISYELKCLLNNNNTFTTTFIFNISENFPIEFNLFGDCQFTPTDFDLDGDMDLVFASEEFSSSADNDYIAWLRNDGSLEFTPLIVSDNIGSFFSFDISDFDLDGDLDLVSSYGPQNGMRIHRNNGSMQFVSELIPVIVGAPVQIKAKDLDNDNDDDIIYCSNVNRRIGWLENLTNDCERIYTSESVTICLGDSVLFADQYFYNSALLTDTLTGINGCDSVNVLMLSIHDNPSINIAFSNNIITATAGFDNYVWYYQGNEIANGSENSIDASDYGIGNYSVQAVSDDGCIISSTTIEVEMIVNLFELPQNKIGIFPNPVKDKMNITSENSNIQEMILYDTTGRMIIRQRTSSSNNTMDIAHLDDGVYFLRCQLTTGESIETTVIKLQ